MKVIKEFFNGIWLMVQCAMVGLGFCFVMAAPAVLMDRYSDDWGYLYILHLIWFIWAVG
ncbi:unnamed protein product, partial [marine sediment metagenome]